MIVDVQLSVKTLATVCVCVCVCVCVPDFSYVENARLCTGHTVYQWLTPPTPSFTFPTGNTNVYCVYICTFPAYCIKSALHFVAVNVSLNQLNFDRFPLVLLYADV